MLDDAGWTQCQISVSNSLDEYIIRDILRQGAQIDMFGVGMGGAVTGQSNFYNNSKKDGKDAFLKRLTIIVGILFVVLVAVVDVLVARGIIK